MKDTMKALIRTDSKLSRWYKPTLASMLVAGGMLCVAPNATADVDYTLGFEALSNNSGISNQYASQFFVDIENLGSTVLFTVRNEVGLTSSITDVYFYDPPTQLDVEAVHLDTDTAVITTSDSEVIFSSFANPGELPGYKDLIGGTVIAHYSADSDSPVKHNGVEASGEFVSFEFDLLEGVTFDQMIEAVFAGDLKVGVHAQNLGVDGEFSDGFITGDNPSIVIVPTPTAIGSVAFMGCLALMRTRRRSRSA